MVTTDLLKLYRQYEGSQRTFGEQATQEQRLINKGIDWDDIDSFIHDVMLVERGLAVPEMAHNGRANCDSEETFQFLRKMAMSQGD